MKQAFELAYEQTEQALQDIDWNSYGSILFISKSIGTVIASAYASRHNIKGKSILFTPLTDTFPFARPGSIAFHGTADPWAETDSIRTLLNKKKSLFSYAKCQSLSGDRRCTGRSFDYKSHNGAC